MRHGSDSQTRLALSTGRSRRCSDSSRRRSGLEGVAIFAGNACPKAGDPSRRRTGHQFGHFTALGDGRAILLGERSRHPAIVVFN
jgi:uncharacterized protein YdiU (UPF0061 family)